MKGEEKSFGFKGDILTRERRQGMKGIGKGLILGLVVILGVLVGGESYGQNIGHTIGASETEYTNSGFVYGHESVGDNSNAGAYGVYAEPSGSELSLLENDGTITAVSGIANVTLNFSAYFSDALGVYVNDRDVGEFINGGSITATATAGDAEGYESFVYADAYGVYTDESYIGSFVNSGDISASAGVGSAVKDDSEVYAYAFGVGFGWSEVDSFENSGSITATATAGDAEGKKSSVDAGAWGVYAENVGSFTNSGDIGVSVVVGNANGGNSSVWAYGISGVEIWGPVEEFDNSGNILVSTTVGDANGIGSYATTYNYEENSGTYGVYIGNDVNVGSFSNTGIISASVSGGSANGEGSEVNAGHVLGVDIGSSGEDLDMEVSSYSEVDSFENSGEISVSATGGNAEGDYSGVYVFTGNPVWVDYSTVYNFTNTETGEIFAYGLAGDAVGYQSEVIMSDFGVGFLGWVDNFSNAGLIEAWVFAGDAEGEGSFVGIVPEWYPIYGVLFGGGLGSGVNSGDIFVWAAGGNASGAGSEVVVYDVCGLIGVGEVDYLVNEGSIWVWAQAGDAVVEGGEDDLDALMVDGDGDSSSSVYVGGVAGVYFGGYYYGPVAAKGYGSLAFDDGFDDGYYGGYFNFTNEGNIVVLVSGGNGSVISEVGGIVVDGAAEAEIVNEGNIYIGIYAPEAESVGEVAGIYVVDSNSYDTVYISNPGAIYLWTNAEGADIRTLAIENSYVMLEDEFAIVFCQEGIYERPIYVDEESYLGLNDTDVIARIGDITLIEFNHPYYLIENEGEVGGEFDEVVPGYLNEDIKVSWYDESERGEDAAVVFRYKPEHSIPALGVHHSLTVAGSMLDRVVAGNEYGASLMAGKKVYLAQAKAGVSDVGPSLGGGITGKENNGVFFYPFYLKVDGDDLKYDGDAKGAVLGYERKLGNGLRLGVFGGYGRGEVDYEVKGADDEDQNIYAGGLYIDQLCRKECPWYLGLTVLGYYAEHEDYKGWTGLDYEIKEKGDYDSYGVEGRFTVGYRIMGKGWELMPSIGAGLTYWHLDSFSTDAADPVWDRHYSSEGEVYGKVMAGISGVKRWGDKDRRYYLGGLVRVEEALGDNDIEVGQGIPAIGTGKVKVEEEVGDFSVTSRLELGVKIRDRYTLSLSPGMTYNSDYKAYGGQALFGIAF